MHDVANAAMGLGCLTVLGALEVKLQENTAPIRQGLRQAGEGLMAAGAEPTKEGRHEAAS